MHCLKRFDDQIPLVTGVRPLNGNTIEQLEAAGGGRGVMKLLKRWLDTGVRHDRR